MRATMFKYSLGAKVSSVCNKHTPLDHMQLTLLCNKALGFGCQKLNPLLFCGVTLTGSHTS